MLFGHFHSAREPDRIRARPHARRRAHWADVVRFPLDVPPHQASFLIHPSPRTLILAAMDTTSNALSITLTLLAERPDVQDKLRAEIMEAMNGEDLDYDALVALPFLDAVCRETLRLQVCPSF